MGVLHNSGLGHRVEALLRQYDREGGIYRKRWAWRDRKGERKPMVDGFDNRDGYRTGLFLKQRFDKLLGIKEGKIGFLFAHADVLHRNSELLANRYHHTAFGGAI